MLKTGGYSAVQWLTVTNLFQAISNGGTIPEDWKKGIILPFYQGKGSRRDCMNYCGITLLSCPGKLFAHFLLARVKDMSIAMHRKKQEWFHLDAPQLIG